MKRALAACFAWLVLAAGLAPGAALAQAHGGRLVETRLATYELVANRDVVIVYVSLKGRKHTSAQGMRASFELVDASGRVSGPWKLLAGNGNDLISRGPFPLRPGKLVATIRIGDHPAERLSWPLR